MSFDRNDGIVRLKKIRKMEIGEISFARIRYIRILVPAAKEPIASLQKKQF